MDVFEFTCVELAGGGIYDAPNNSSYVNSGISLQEGDVLLWAGFQILEAFPSYISQINLLSYREAAPPPGSPFSQLYNVQNVVPDFTFSDGMVMSDGSTGLQYFAYAGAVAVGAGPENYWLNWTGVPPNQTDPGRGILRIVKATVTPQVAQVVELRHPGYVQLEPSRGRTII